MNSQIIGDVSLDETLLGEELQKILQFDFNSEYSEFARGNPGWKNCILWNETGLQHDTVFKIYRGTAKKTELGQQLGYINSIIESTFNVEFLRWVRIFLVHKGLIIPHKDYLDIP